MRIFFMTVLYIMFSTEVAFYKLIESFIHLSIFIYNFQIKLDFKQLILQLFDNLKTFVSKF